MVEPQETKGKRLTLKDLRNLEIAVKSSITVSDQYIQSGENEHETVLSEIKIAMQRLKKSIGGDLFKEVVGVQQNDFRQNNAAIDNDFLISLQDEIKKIQIKLLAKSTQLEEINKLLVKQSKLLQLAFDIQNDSKQPLKKPVEGKEEEKNEDLVHQQKDQDYDKQENAKVDGNWIIQQLTLSMIHSNSNFPSQKPVDCKFEGETLDGIPNGYGNLAYIHEKDLSNLFSFTQYGHFKDGKLHGPSYRIDGDKYINCSTYQNGVRNGIVKVYTPLGVPCYLGLYKDGKRNGYGQKFHGNGTLCYEGNFGNNMYNGKGKFFYKESTFEGEWLNDLKASGIVQLLGNDKKFKVEYNPLHDKKKKIFHQQQKPVKEEPLLD